MKKLPAKREIFCQEFIVDLNATQAALRAGYSKRTAYAQGSRLLKSVDVVARIAELQTERAKRVQVDADSVLQRLAAIGFGVVQATPVEVRALELAGKHIGMFVERIDHTVTALSPDERRKRLEALYLKAASRKGEDK